jgi:hypothetical protein
MASRIESIDVSMEELEQLVEAAGSGPLPAEGQQKLKAAVRTLGAVAAMLAERDATIQQLRALLSVPRTTEKTRKVLDVAPPAEPPRDSTTKRKKGHGRRAAGERGCAESECPTSRLARGGSLSGVPEGKSVPAVGAEETGADRRPAAAAGDGIRTARAAL